VVRGRWLVLARRRAGNTRQQAEKEASKAEPHGTPHVRGNDGLILNANEHYFRSYRSGPSSAKSPYFRQRPLTFLVRSVYYTTS
jgi:hypothetical protein